MKTSDAEIRFENAVYQASLDMLESLESQGLIVSKGCNIAQDIAAYAKEKLGERILSSHFSMTKDDLEILQAFMR